MTYVESFDGQQNPPPYFFPKVSVNACVLKATQDNLQRWCNTFLNLGNGHRFKPLVPFVYVGISHYPKMFCAGHENMGYAIQDEYFVMVPLVHYRNFFNLWIPVGLTWGFPFIGVTNGTSAISGQTVIGFPKMVGSITRTTMSGGAFHGEVEMPGFPVFDSNTQQRQMPIIAMRTDAPLQQSAPTGPVSGAAPAATLSFPWSLLHAGTGITDIEDEILEFLDDLIPGLYSTTVLKQIRDAEDPTQACFQSLVSAQWQIDDPLSSIEFSGGEVDVFDNASVDIIATLGLADGTAIPPPSVISAPTPDAGGPLAPAVAAPRSERFKALAAFEMQVDIHFGDLRNLGL
ncbi:hypothetical protein [Polymorphobacter fuscus]|uniref:Acetoacetate decarboxylase n=1 Tax=Sandarakinorhabdus fusca TaxID=1439888 RepID=A0A7C9KJ28_9SPHN|nr:hypothetical protein [Polymorphobacter fuscus]KAB7645572.1 hypothetical protein F9290_12210 [Polymorphobacter fuscus]MQT18020.1 hypothetical protein [Polymorphobacter fuscus]NJC08652.1 hypothetical protein [Polymorphobacter fuscus]